METHETTIYYHDVQLNVTYDFTPAEEDTYDFQGCDAEATIIDVKIPEAEVDIISILTENQLEDIEYLVIIEHMNS